MPPATSPTAMRGRSRGEPTAEESSPTSSTSHFRKSTEKTEEEEEGPSTAPSTSRRKPGRPKRSKVSEDKADVDNEPTHYQDFDEDESDDDARFAGSKKNPKYYIVKNEKSGRPTEVFRTDQLHALRQGAFNQEDSDEDCGPYNGMIKLHDRWREEWNYGIQVPVSCHNLPLFETAPNELGSALPANFELPAKYIGINPQTSQSTTSRHQISPVKYVTPASHEMMVLPERLLYNGDRLDEIWLQKANKAREHIGHNPLAMKQFLRIMNALEIQCYIKLHDELLAPLHLNPTMGTSDDDTCDVCGSGDTNEEDQILYCDNCNACFHLSCYGLEELPEDGSWSCQKCLLCGDNVPPCIMCPTRGGALKLTEPVDGVPRWCHVGCALWIPECRFADPERRETVTGLDNIPEDRWKLKCCICDTRDGCCFQCRFPACPTAFHIGCAIRSGYEMRIEPNHEDPESDAIQMIALCNKHRTVKTSALHLDENETKSKLSSDEEVDDRENQTLRNLEARFYMYVDEEEIISQLKEDRLAVSDVYEYWKLKRHQLGGRPLVTNPQDEIFSNGNGGTTPNENSIIGRLKMLTTKVTHMYDKQRNLSYLITQREKAKLDMVNIDLDIINNIWDQLTSHVPLSDRVTAQLVDHLKVTMSQREIAAVEIKESQFLEEFTPADNGEASAGPSTKISKRKSSPIKSTPTKIKGAQIMKEPISDGEREPSAPQISPPALRNRRKTPNLISDEELEPMTEISPPVLRSRIKDPNLLESTLRKLPVMKLALRDCQQDIEKLGIILRTRSPPKKQKEEPEKEEREQSEELIPTPRKKSRAQARKRASRPKKRRPVVNRISSSDEELVEESESDQSDNDSSTPSARKPRKSNFSGGGRISKSDLIMLEEANLLPSPTSSRKSRSAAAKKPAPPKKVRVKVETEEQDSDTPYDEVYTPIKGSPRVSRYLPMPTSTGEKAERRMTRSIGPPIAFIDLTIDPEPPIKRIRFAEDKEDSKEVRRRSVKQELIDAFNADAPLPPSPVTSSVQSRNRPLFVKTEPPDDYDYGGGYGNPQPSSSGTISRRRISRAKSEVSSEHSVEIGPCPPLIRRTSPRRHLSSASTSASSLYRHSPELSEFHGTYSPVSPILRSSPQKDGISSPPVALRTRRKSSTSSYNF